MDNPSRWATIRVTAPAIASLVLISTFLPELFSGSTPLLGFLAPGLFLFLLLGYGLAVLVVRELAVRCGAGLAGLLLFGFGYGIFNEGLLAKTLIIDEHLPLPTYDHYGVVMGISVPFAVTIAVWHAFASVAFPIVLTHHCFPKARHVAWLKTSIVTVLGIVLLFLGSAVFLGTSPKGITGTRPQLAVFLVTILACCAVASRLKGTMPSVPSTAAVKPLLAGFCVIVPFFALAAIAGAKLSPAVFFACLAAIVGLYAWLLNRNGWLAPPPFAFFGLGWYLHNTLMALLTIAFLLHAAGRALYTGLVAAAILLLLFRQVRTSAIVTFHD